MQADERGTAGDAGIPVCHGDDGALVDAEDILGRVLGVHEGCEEGQFGGAGVAEHAVRALAAQDLQQGEGGAATHGGLLGGYGDDGDRCAVSVGSPYHREQGQRVAQRYVVGSVVRSLTGSVIGSLIGCR